MDDNQAWWHDYGLNLPEDEPIKMPPWPEVKRMRQEIARVGGLFLQDHWQAYRGEDGEYVRILLDLGDRPLRIELWDRDLLIVEAPVYINLPARRDVYRYILADLAALFPWLHFQLDAGSVLVAFMRARADGIVAELHEMLSDFVDRITRARKELEAYLESHPGGGLQDLLPPGLRGL